jgi:hypothetical protein
MALRCQKRGFQSNIQRIPHARGGEPFEFTRADAERAYSPRTWG